MMNKKSVKTIVTVMMAVVVMMAACTVISSAASKKAYKLPSKIKYQDYTDKVTYKGNKITFKSADSGTEKYTCKSSTKYKVKITSPYGSSGSATIKAKKNKVALKKGKTFKLKGKAVAASKKLKVKKHRGIAYESDNAAVATVTKAGVVKGVKKGTAYVYAYAQDGACAKVKVTVK